MNSLGYISLEASLSDNIHQVAKALNKPIRELTVITLAKPRHNAAITMMQKMGVKVFAIPDGDVAASILTCMPDSEVDMMYCIGGAPEGVISAAVIRAFGGDMQGQLLTRDQAKGDSEANKTTGELEKKRCHDMGVEPSVILSLNDIVRSDNVVFSATGITKGDLLEGISRSDNIAQTETLVIRGKSRTIRRIKSIHYLNRKDDDVKEAIF